MKWKITTPKTRYLIHMTYTQYYIHLYIHIHTNNCIQVHEHVYIYMYIYLTFEPTFCIQNEEPNNFQPPPEAQQQFFPDPSVVNNQKIHLQFNKTKKRCGHCNGCRTPDCTVCKFCRDKKKFGGPAKLKKCCIRRQCTGNVATSDSTQSNSQFSNARESDSLPNDIDQPSLTKTEILRDSLTSPNYIKLGDFPDKPIPPKVLQLLQPPTQHKKECDITHHLLQQNRKIVRIVGDGNCFFRSLSFFLFNTQQEHLRVRKEIVEFITANTKLFDILVISADNNYTLTTHLENVRKPMVWASQVEIQAAADLYGVPIYLFTPKPSGLGYHWYCYNKRTLSVPLFKYSHIELAHKSGIHFDCIVDATSLRPCVVPPLLTGEHTYYEDVL